MTSFWMELFLDVKTAGSEVTLSVFLGSVMTRIR